MPDVAVETLKESFEDGAVVSAQGFVRYNGRYAKTFSNGTWGTFINSMANKPSKKKPSANATPAAPKKRAPRVGTHMKFSSWAFPFVEGADLMVVRRTNELNEGKTGNDNFSYAQFTLLPLFPPLWLIGSMLLLFVIMFFSKISFIRNYLLKQKSTDGGPNKEQRKDTSVDVIIEAKDGQGKKKTLKMKCPGPYDSTGVASAEAALALVYERASLKKTFGVVTPGAVMNKQLQANLQKRGGLSWEIQ